MQALRRRTRDAERQVKRRQAKHNAKRANDIRAEQRLKGKLRKDIIRENLNVDRQERWDRWFLGPLRTGGAQGTGKGGNGVAGLLQRKAIPPELERDSRERKRLKWAVDERRIAAARERRVLAGGPRGKNKMEKGPQDTIVVSNSYFL